MKYVLLIYTEPDACTAYADTGQRLPLTGYADYNAEARRKEVLVAAEMLYPITVATTIRVRQGKTFITDGPFAQTEAQLDGYYVLDCLDEDVAAQWAAKHPGLRDGMIEIRPVVELAYSGTDD